MRCSNKISAHCFLTWILFFNYVTNHLETKGKKATICKDIAGRKPSVEFIWEDGLNLGKLSIQWKTISTFPIVSKAVLLDWVISLWQFLLSHLKSVDSSTSKKLKYKNFDFSKTWLSVSWLHKKLIINVLNFYTTKYT